MALRTRADGRKWVKGNVPAFVTKPNGEKGPLWRTCTADYKLAPLEAHAKKLAAIKRGQKTIGVVQWIGISLDEAHRMKPSRLPWAKNRWPLIDAGMKRHDCLLWMEAKGYPRPPRSACSYCPFHSDAEWRRLRDDEPEAFAQAVDFERRLQAASAEADCHVGRVTLHRSGLNLDEVDFSTDIERGQGELFGNDCTGLCGV